MLFRLRSSAGMCICRNWKRFVIRRTLKLEFLSGQANRSCS